MAITLAPFIACQASSLLPETCNPLDVGYTMVNDCPEKGSVDPNSESQEW